MASPDEQKADITLNSPVGSKSATYKWPLTWVSRGQKIDGADEIVETIRWVAREYPEFKPAIENLLHDQDNFKTYESIKTLCDKYNKITDYVMKMNKGTSIALKTSSRASQGLLKHIIQQVYNYAVADPTELNKYSPFSSETYGETSFSFMAQLIDRNQFKPKENDTFIDLGSGVGHLVLQTAATVKCKKCYGIEIADVPAGYAKRMEERFKFWMNWHGKTYTEFELFHGDFFEKKYAEIIKNSTYIFVNNFAFKPDDDHKLKQRFLDLKDGTQILSSKPFCSPKNRVTERNLSDLGSIMHVVEILPDNKKDSVSWTPKPLPYYLHVLDSTRIEKYYEKQKRRQGRAAIQDKGRPTKRRRLGKGTSDSFSDDSDENFVYGPTTRKAWSEWCNASNTINSSNRTSTDSPKTSISGRNNSTDTETIIEGVNSEDHEKEETDLSSLTKESSIETQKRDKKNDTHNIAATNFASAEKKVATSQETNAQANKNANSTSGNVSSGSNSSNSNQTPRSCLDKKRDYAIKKGGSNSLQNANTSSFYSITKPVDNSNGSTSSSKIPNIVIKVKPPSGSKVVSQAQDSKKSTSDSTKTPTETPQVNDENGKKLRQRKKPATVSDPTPEVKGTSAVTAATNLKSNSTTASSKQAASNSKTKRAPAAGKAATAKAPGAGNKKSSSAHEKNPSLDLLHAKTIQSFSGSSSYCPQPAPGCEDHNLNSITDTPSLPNVVIKDASMYVRSVLAPKSLDKFIETTKSNFERFAHKLEQPNARESLIRSIEREQARQYELKRAEDDLNKHIKILTERIPKAMKVHCDELGIKNTQKTVINLLGNLLKKHQDLLAYSQQLEAALQPTQRVLNPPAAHSSSSQAFSAPSYRESAATSTATLDLSLKQTA